MASKNYILWLVSWYPSKINAFNGDFIERQARAVSQYQRIIVLYVVEDPSLSGKSIIIEKNVVLNLTTYIVYYSVKPKKNKKIKRLINIYAYLKVTRIALKKVRKENGKPILVHVHVIFWAGIAALFFKIFNLQRYILTEHWSYFLPNADHNFYQKNRLEQFLVKEILKNALFILPVSDYLGKCLKEINHSLLLKVVPNTVDTSLFYYPSPLKEISHTFVHVSAMTSLKQPEKILRAFATVSAEIKDWKLEMIGPANESLLKIATENGLLNTRIFFTGEIPYVEVAKKTRMADASILFSKYETQSCVILEALCCGVPVIAPNIPPITEMINTDNGLLFSPDNEEELCYAIIYLANNIHLFDREKIAATAHAKYNYITIGRQLNEIYHTFTDM